MQKKDGGGGVKTKRKKASELIEKKRGRGEREINS